MRDDGMRVVWKSPRSQWLKASAAAVRSYDPIRAELWREIATDLERQEVQRHGRATASVSTKAGRTRSAVARIER